MPISGQARRIAAGSARAKLRITMCGRFFLSKSGAEIARHFDLADEPILAPRFNIAPTQQIPLVRNQPHDPTVPRSEPKASGELHKARARTGNQLRPHRPA